MQRRFFVGIIKLQLYVGIFLLTCVAVSQEVRKQEHNQKKSREDIKVGIVLSGGGAKGLAHIGALKIIEEVGVRVDYIAGTSMGAIVGSLYASGYKARELDSIFRKVDFGTLIQDNLPRNVKTYYEREDSERYALTLPFDNFKVELPKGFSKGQNFFNEFSKFTSHVHQIEDFSKLPIPFFCIATNIANGEQVILDKGYLPQAVSASSALPSIFSPVEIDGKLLTDGGVSNNYPIEELRARGAEVIIGIDVQDSLLAVDQLNTATNIMVQIGNFRTIEAMKKAIPDTDVYIKPQIRDYSALSFDKLDQIITKGEEAASNVKEDLQKLSARQIGKSDRIIMDRTPDSIHINTINIKGNERYTRAYIKGKLKLKKPKKITYNQLYEGINNLSATGNFDRINFQIDRNPLGNELAFNVKESTNTMLLRLGIHYDDLYKTGGLVNLTKKRLFFNDDVAAIDVVVGDNIRYDFNYYIDRGFYWSIGIKNSFNRFDRNVDFEILRGAFSLPDFSVNKIDLEYEDLKSQFYLQTLLDNNFSFGIGAEHRRFKLTSETITGVDDEVERIVFDKNDYVSAISFIRFDSYDNKYFPSDGFLLNGFLNYYVYHTNDNNKEEAFAQIKANVGYAVSISPKTCFNLDASAGARFGGRTN